MKGNEMWKTLAIRAALVLIVPVSATAGAALLAWNPAAHSAFCEGTR